MPNCSMIVNTASNTALNLTATLNAKSVKVAGSIYLDWGGSLTATSASVGPNQIYQVHARTRKSAGSMTRKLSVTWSQ